MLRCAFSLAALVMGSDAYMAAAPPEDGSSRPAGGSNREVRHQRKNNMDYTITQEEVKNLQDFLDGKNDSILFSDLPEKLYRFAEAVRRRSLETARASARKLNTVSTRLERMRCRQEAKREAGDFPCLGLATIDIAYTALHHARRMGLQLPMETLMAIIYDTYANWLCSSGERITMESPVCQEKGVWFWSIARRFDYQKPDLSESLRRVAEADPGIITIVGRVTAKYAPVRKEDIIRYITGTKPYRNALPEHHSGKWNGPVSDADTYAWKKTTAKESRS